MNMSTETNLEILKWLLNCPSGDVNFKSQLANANEITIRCALAEIDDNEVTKKKALERGLKKLLEAEASSITTTNDHHGGVLKMDVATYEAEREAGQQLQIAQSEREKLIAQCHEAIGRIQGVEMLSKMATVASLVWMRDMKAAKTYRDLPGIGTWDKFCEYLGKDRRTVDEDLQNLSIFGEQFLETVASLQVGYRELRKLRQLTHDGAVIIEGECLRIADESPIPIDQNHAEELQAAIERIITDRQEINKRLTRLEKDFKGAVKEETLSYQSKEKALLERVKTLEQYEPKPMDETRFEAQYKDIMDQTAILATKIASLMKMDNLEENPVLAARVEGFVASVGGLSDKLREEWAAQFQIY
jgi:hypothetical protein